MLWPNAGPCGNPHQIRDRPHAHLAHHSTAMQLDCLFADADLRCYLLIEPPGHAEAIRRREGGEALTDIGRSYGVSHSTISRLGYPRIHMVAAE
jgi:hypothetical protein